MHASVGVAKQNIEVIADPGMLPGDADVSEHGLRHTEQDQGLVDDMRPEILDDAGPGARFFLVRLWA